MRAGVVLDLVALACVIVITPDLGDLSGLEGTKSAGCEGHELARKRAGTESLPPN